MAALTAEYKTTPEALGAISKGLDDFYKTKYPGLYASRRAQIQAAIEETRRIFSANIFPEMKLDWRTHPDNVGHFYFAGCFRCHDGNHVSADGKTIARDCEICHTFLPTQEGAGASNLTTVKGTAFQHPVDIGDLTSVDCKDCHSGGAGP